MEALTGFFKPQSVAIIGASATKGKVGNIILSNMLYGSSENEKNNVFGGFKGEIYPINPQADEILGIKAYNSLTAVPKPVDMAVICIPPKGVKDAIENCGKTGIKSAVIITAGFSETGEEGANTEKEILVLAKKHNIRIIGPNCLGIISTYSDLNATFGDAVPKRGPISFASQSGALCTSVIQYSFEEFLGFSNFVSIGNKSDVDDADLIQYFHKDPNTKCIMLYIESLRDARKFFETARRVVRDKPIVAFKSGYTEEGAKATSSHTGSIAGSEAAYDAAFRQSGHACAQRREYSNLNQCRWPRCPCCGYYIQSWHETFRTFWRYNRAVKRNLPAQLEPSKPRGYHRRRNGLQIRRCT